jgi:hypothetical protein
MDEEYTPTVPEQILSEEEQPQNLLDQLAARRKTIAETKEVTIPVPGYDREPPLLLIRYRLLEGPDMAKIANKVSRETKNRWQRGIFAAADTFIEAIVGFYVDLGDGMPQPLTYHGEHITAFSMQLAEALQFSDELVTSNGQPVTARRIVFALFANNDIALSQHNFVLNSWFADTSLDVSEAMLTAGNL